MSWKPAFILCLFVFLTSTGSATTHVVRPDGSGDFTTIQDAIGASNNGDVIELTDGTFTGEGNRDISYSGKAITIRSQSGNAANCIIDCEGTPSEAHRGFKFFTGEGRSSVLQSVTVTGGYLPDWPPRRGGAVCCSTTTSPLFIGCVFSSNTASDGGGAVSCNGGGSPGFENCIFEANSTTTGYGGGILIDQTTVEVTNCSFLDNDGFGGGGAYCEWDSSRFVGCTFSGNSSGGLGGGMYITHRTSVDECAFLENYADLMGGGVFIYRTHVDGPPIANSLFDSNTTGVWGGGIMLSGDSDYSVETCTFLYNRAFSTNPAGQGGGIALGNYARANISGCTFYENAAMQGGAIAPVLAAPPGPTTASVENSILSFSTMGEAVYCEVGCSADLICCDVIGNVGGDWVGCIAGQDALAENFSADPRYCDPVSDDFHLRSDSPCAPDQSPVDCGLIGAWPVGCSAATAACCDLSTGTCTLETVDDCLASGGEFHLEWESCVPNPCPQPIGACCDLETGACSLITETECDGLGWEFHPEWDSCDPNPCPQPVAACCDLETGACSLTTETECDGVAEEYHPEWGICDPNPCPQPQGVCCRGTACELMTAAQCTLFEGDWYADLLDCEPNPCPAPATAACCVDSVCVVVSEPECASQQGEWHPEWTDCLPGLCHEDGPPCPPGWIDRYDEVFVVFPFEVPGIFERRPIIVSGPASIFRGPADFQSEGDCHIDTEILELDLVGTYDPAIDCGGDHFPLPATVSLDTLGIYGQIKSSTDIDGTPTYPDTSWYNIFILVSVDGQGPYAKRITVKNLLTSGDLWGDPPCVNPDSPYQSEDEEFGLAICATSSSEGCCEFPPGIGNGCLITSPMICALLNGVYSGDGTTNCQVSGIGRTGDSQAILGIELHENPSMIETRIVFELAQGGPVRLEVYDGSGRLIRRLIDEPIEAGRHTVEWDRRTPEGREVPVGLYFIRLRHGDQERVTKATILR